MHFGGVGYHTVEVKKDRIVSVARDDMRVFRPSPLLLKLWALIHQRPVPDFHSRYITVVAEDAQRACIQEKVLAATRGQPDPARREHAQHVSVREQQNVAVEGASARDNPIDPCANLLGRFATRAAVSEDQPARRYLVDLFGGLALVLAVIPLGQVRVDHHILAETRQFARLARPLHRAAEREPREISGKDWPHPFGDPAAMVGQRNVSRPRVLATKAPCRLTVPDREDVHVHLLEVRRYRILWTAPPRKRLLVPNARP